MEKMCMNTMMMMCMEEMMCEMNCMNMMMDRMRKMDMEMNMEQMDV